MPYKTFSAQGDYTDPVQITGRFNVEVLTDPAGSTVQLQKSLNGATGTYYLCYGDTTKAEYTAQCGELVENFGQAYFRLYCNIYGGTPFYAGISSGNTLGT